MTYTVLGNIPGGGERRRYDSEVELEVDASRGFVPTWVGHGFLPHLKELSGTVLDYGCGGGLLGLHAAVQEKVERVIFLDIDANALKLSADNAQWNLVTGKCDFVSSVDDVLERVDTVIANLPEDPNLDFCGTDGSTLQREIVLERVPELLKANGQLITKSVSYAKEWSREEAFSQRYEIENIGRACGITPESFRKRALALAKIYRLTLNGN